MLSTLLLFVVSTLAVNLTPGPSILYVSSVTAANGFVAGLYAVAGMSVAIMIHVLAAAVGITAVINASEFAFTLLRYGGALYLVYLGVQVLSKKPRGQKPRDQKPGGLSSATLVSPASHWSHFRKGIIVDLLNPKIGVFFLAFFPQFIGGLGYPSFVSSVLLGLIFITLGAVVNSLVAASVAGGVSRMPQGLKQLFERWLPGCILLILGVRLALPDM